MVGEEVNRSWLWRATLLIAVRPWLWRTAFRFVGWPPWKLRPYMKFRYETAYGGTVTGRTGGNPADVVPFLRWAKAFKC